MEGLSNLALEFGPQFGTLSIATLLVVQAIKKANYIQSRFLPITSVIVGIVLSLMFPSLSIVSGLIAGGLAIGEYEVVKKTILGK